MCVTSLILRAYCPQMCNESYQKACAQKLSCLNGARQDPTRAIYCPTLCGKCVAQKTCPQALQCQNGAKQDLSTCNSDCFPVRKFDLYRRPFEMQLFERGERLHQPDNRRVLSRNVRQMRSTNHHAKHHDRLQGIRVSQRRQFRAHQVRLLVLSVVFRAALRKSRLFERDVCVSVFYYCPRLCNQCTTHHFNDNHNLRLPAEGVPQRSTRLRHVLVRLLQ